MAKIDKSTYRYVIMDPLQPQTQHENLESTKKKLVPGQGGWMQTANKHLAQELKQKRPWMIVREFEYGNAGQSVRFTVTVPSLPWKYDRQRHLDFAEMYNAYYDYLNERE